jgi:hypothetical protein
MMNNQYLVFASGQTVTNEVFTGSALPTDPNHTYILWNIVNNDNNPNNYILVNGQLTYTPPPSPNINQFVALMMADTTLTLTVKERLAAYFGVIETYNANTAMNIRTIWSGIIADVNNKWLTASDITIIEKYAAQCDIPLTS